MTTPTQPRTFGLADEEQILIELTRLEIAYILSGLLQVSATLAEAGVGDDSQRVHDLALSIAKAVAPL